MEGHAVVYAGETAVDSGKLSYALPALFLNVSSTCTPCETEQRDMRLSVGILGAHVEHPASSSIIYG